MIKPRQEALGASDAIPDNLELSNLIEFSGWSVREVARRLSVGESTPRNWMRRPGRVPVAVLVWMRAVVRGIEAAGMPEGWRYGTPPASE